jgi:hypothetical protein
MYNGSLVELRILPGKIRSLLPYQPGYIQEMSNQINQAGTTSSTDFQTKPDQLIERRSRPLLSGCYQNLTLKANLSQIYIKSYPNNFSSSTEQTSLLNHASVAQLRVVLPNQTS